jgi:hypothetical protein
MMPASAHTSSNHTGEPSCDIMSAGFINTPEPMMPPATTAMVDDKPSVLRKPDMSNI